MYICPKQRFVQGHISAKQYTLNEFKMFLWSKGNRMKTKGNKQIFKKCLFGGVVMTEVVFHWKKIQFIINFIPCPDFTKNSDVKDHIQPERTGSKRKKKNAN